MSSASWRRRRRATLRLLVSACTGAAPTAPPVSSVALVDVLDARPGVRRVGVDAGAPDLALGADADLHLLCKLGSDRRLVKSRVIFACILCNKGRRRLHPPKGCCRPRRAVRRQRRLGTRCPLLPPESPRAVAACTRRCAPPSAHRGRVRYHTSRRRSPRSAGSRASRPWDVHEPVVLAGPARGAAARRALEVALRKLLPGRRGRGLRGAGEREGAGAGSASFMFLRVDGRVSEIRHRPWQRCTPSVSGQAATAEFRAII